jgi:hypothetical protein
MNDSALAVTVVRHHNVKDFRDESPSRSSDCRTSAMNCSRAGVIAPLGEELHSDRLELQNFRNDCPRVAGIAKVLG